MKFTTSNLSSVKADIRICPMPDLENPFKFKRVFLGLHLDFSAHQTMLYLGIFHLFIEIYDPRPNEATVDYERVLWRRGRTVLVWHTTNHKPHDYFFNIGTTISSDGITFFFWKLRLHVAVNKRDNRQ